LEVVLSAALEGGSLSPLLIGPSALAQILIVFSWIAVGLRIQLVSPARFRKRERAFV